MTETEQKAYDIIYTHLTWHRIGMGEFTAKLLTHTILQDFRASHIDLVNNLQLSGNPQRRSNDNQPKPE